MSTGLLLPMGVQMKKLFCLLCVLCLSVSLSLAGGFRGIEWGASKEAVIEKEGKPVQEQGGAVEVLAYQDTLINLDWFAGFVFANNKLVRGAYLLNEKHSNNNLFIQDYEAVKKALTEKYGEPIADNKTFSDDLYRDDPERWGTAIAVGRLKMGATWQTGTEEIVLLLSGDNFEVKLAINYVSNDLGHLEDEAKKQSEKDKF